MTTILDIPGTNPPNPFSAAIQALLATPKPEATADLVTSVTTSADPANALWQVWDAFFTAVVHSTSHVPHLALLDALRAQPPSQPNNIRTGSDAGRRLRSSIGPDGKLHWSELPRFSAQWRDVHDILEAWRDWDGVREDSATGTVTSRLDSSCAEFFLRFVNFSAALLKAAFNRSESEIHPVNVFYACRAVLEHDLKQAGLPQDNKPEAKAHRISPEQTWALDIRVAATWMRDGGRALWKMDYGELRQGWAAALDDTTALWPRQDGLTRERWELWGNRLRELSTEEILDGDTRAVVVEAAEVVGRLLED
ncbi:hypothetical protein BDW71DRAFT_186320 [Aspergillus fruticulosus]